MGSKKTVGVKPVFPQKEKASGTSPAAEVQPEGLAKHLPSGAAVREIVESVVIAFVLAFLFRTFEAEAFVIPTGSMAPTLMGRHKDLTCPNCGYSFQASASDEVTSTGSYRGPAFDVVACTCPMCRYPVEAGPDKHRSFKGDRIIVNKFAYQFSDPQRWDVAVFKYPGAAATNYIKRIIGLPGETIRIWHGDVYVRRSEETEFQIARKPPDKVLAMLQPVYDNDYIVPEMIAQGWPPRWQNWSGSSGVLRGGWQASDDFRSYRTDGSREGEVWLRYQHLVPSYQDWQQMGRTKPAPKPQLISDFAAYNTNRDRSAYRQHPGPEIENLGLHWVGDLAVECEVEVESPGGRLVLELVEGGWRMQCHLELASGDAALRIDGLPDFQPRGKTPVRGPGKYRLRFANIDDQLLLWVNGRLISFDAPTAYPELNNRRPQEADLAPVGVAAADGAVLTVRHLKIFRDVYYIAERGQTGPAISDFEPWRSPYRPATAETVVEFLSSPQQWDAFLYLRQVEFRLDKDQFLVLGDNSPRSRDSRLWEQDGFEYYVSRDLLLGKALLIYWPHAWDRIPGTNIPFPLFPNFGRMRLIR
ncbi:MAG TPA: signal peptidase I [Thermoguttaceae bacterium]|nr:signal peptidase I [Thermoguttaceae bacterium]